MNAPRNAFFFHGKPSKEKWLDPRHPHPARDNWLPDAADRFGAAGLHVWCPELPEPHDPNPEQCDQVLGAYAAYYPGSYMCGLSFGAAQALRVISQRPGLKVSHLDLVAPHIDPERKRGFGPDEEQLGRLASQVGSARIFFDERDVDVVQQSVELMGAALPDAEVVMLPKGHFLWRRTELDAELNMEFGDPFDELTVPPIMLGSTAADL